MSEPAHPPLATITEVPMGGMIVLRGALDDPAVAAAVTAATGLGMPDRRGIRSEGVRAVLWMSPDEALLVVPADAVAGAMDAAQAAAEGSFVTLADVSDARVAFRIEGVHADEVVMKLCPVDIARLPEGELRRTRAAQIAAALWRSGPSAITLMCWRSVADHARQLLENAARPGSTVFPVRSRG
ncbi:MAG: sarcosine oxidase subunit gamma [Alkalilacustris sp.]